MKNYLQITFFLLLILLVKSLSAQEFTLENIKPKNFYGVYDIPEFGFIICHKQKSKLIFEVYNHDFDLVSDNSIDVKKWDLAKIQVYANDSSYLIFMREQRTKGSYHAYIMTFDFEGNPLGQLLFEGREVGIIAKHNHYYIFNSVKEGTTLELTKHSSRLESQWIHLFEKGRTSFNSDFVPIDRSMARLITNKVFYVYTYIPLKKGSPRTYPTISTLDIETGNLIYNFSFADIESDPVVFYAKKDALELLLYKFSETTIKKRVNLIWETPVIEDIYSMTLDDKGNIIDSVSISFTGQFEELYLFNPKRLHYEQQYDYYQNGIRLITELLYGDEFGIFYFNNDFTPKDSFYVKKKRSYQLLDYKKPNSNIDFLFTVDDAQANFDWIVYIHKTKVMDSVEAVAANGSTNIYNLNTTSFIKGTDKIKDITVLRDYYKVLPHRRGSAIFVLYTRKKRLIEVFKLTIEK